MAGHPDGYRAALIAYDQITCEVRRVVAMEDDTMEDERADFFKAILKLSWIPPKVRRAIMGELGLSLRAQHRGVEHARAVTLQFMVTEEKARMRKDGERPRGGIHEAALGEVARGQGMKAASLKKRLQRNKSPRAK